jgi:hypothetical protein
VAVGWITGECASAPAGSRPDEGKEVRVPAPQASEEARRDAARGLRVDRFKQVGEQRALGRCRFVGHSGDLPDVAPGDRL